MLPDVGERAVYTGLVIGAHTAQNGMTKFRYAEALWKPPGVDYEDRHATPSPRHWVAPTVAERAVFMSLVIGAQAAKNRRTKFPLR